MKIFQYRLWIICAALGVSAICLPRLVLGGDSPAPATQSVAGPDAKRLTFLGDQLSADEAAIKAINKALVMAGYKAATAAMKADMAAEGNSIMDRKGGAPVPWQEFYGRTAKDFIMHDVGSPVYHQVQRPSQFDYIYHANNQQADAAKAEIAAMGAKIDALLARRRQLEAEQSSIWATIALESIGNRDLSLQPLYHNELKVKPSKDNDNRPDAARLAAMRAAVLYLRTVDHTVTSLADQLDSDQEKVYTMLRDTLQQAQQTLKESAASFADTPSVDLAEVKQMKDVTAQAKRMQALCKDVCDAYRKAADADVAAEEGRKLLYRATLQDSLFTFAEATGQLDDTLTKIAGTWDIHALTGTKSTDQPLAVVISEHKQIDGNNSVVNQKQAAITISTAVDIHILPLKEGQPRLYNSNPLRIIEGVGTGLSDWVFTSIPQRTVNSYDVHVNKACTIYVFGVGDAKRLGPNKWIAPDAVTFSEQPEQWQPATGAIVGFNLAVCYQRTFKAGESIKIKGFELQIAAESIMKVADINSK